MLLPKSWGEIGDAARWMQGDALQDIDQVGVGVDAVQTAGDDEGLDDADVLGAEFGPAKEPSFLLMKTYA